MKIKTRLYLGAILTISLIVCLVMMALYFLGQMQEEVKKTQAANQLDR
jgi:hypothetical protein